MSPKNLDARTRRPSGANARRRLPPRRRSCSSTTRAARSSGRSRPGRPPRRRRFRRGLRCWPAIFSPRRCGASFRAKCARRATAWGTPSRRSPGASGSGATGTGAAPYGHRPCCSPSTVSARAETRISRGRPRASSATRRRSRSSRRTSTRFRASRCATRPTRGRRRSFWCWRTSFPSRAATRFCFRRFPRATGAKRRRSATDASGRLSTAALPTNALRSTTKRSTTGQAAARCPTSRAFSRRCARFSPRDVSPRRTGSTPTR